jgi:hypothetical protein
MTLPHEPEHLHNAEGVREPTSNYFSDRPPQALSLPLISRKVGVFRWRLCS